MLTSAELENNIHSLVISRDALTAFCRRLAIAFEDALEKLGVQHHALNDGVTHSVGDGFDLVAGIDFITKDMWRVRASLGWTGGDLQLEPFSLTDLTDTQVAKVAEKWAEVVAAGGRNVVFRALYEPKSVDFAETYNDLRVTFRIVRAWDIVTSGWAIRIDSVFKNLNA